MTGPTPTPPLQSPASSSPASTVSPWRWGYPAALAFMIFLASGRSKMASPGFALNDKLVHFLIFGLLATLVCRSPGLKRWGWAVLLVSAYGIADEFRQSFTPGRYVEFDDWVADTSGAAVAVTLYTLWAGYRRLLETPLRWPHRPGTQSPQPKIASSSPSVSLTP